MNGAHARAPNSIAVFDESLPPKHFLPSLGGIDAAILGSTTMQRCSSCNEVEFFLLVLLVDGEVATLERGNDFPRLLHLIFTHLHAHAA